MPWIKLDDKFSEHHKIMEVGPLGMALYVAGLAYCARNTTDGVIPRRAARMLIDLTGITVDGQAMDTPAVIADLLRVGLWHEEDHGYSVHDYLKYQPSREHIEAIKEARAEAGSKGGQSSVSSKTQANDKQNASKSSSPNPIPVNPNPVNPNPVNPKPDEEPSPAPADKPPKFDFKRLWALIETQQDYLPTWNYTVETQVVKAILKTHPDATADHLAAFIAYKRTCFGIDPASQPSFSKYKGDFGSWVAAGMPTRQERNANGASPRGQPANVPKAITDPDIADKYAPGGKYSFLTQSREAGKGMKHD